MKELFKKDPNWDYPKKIAIASELSMTLQQVSKWNWDHRKKLGLPTDRRQAAKKTKQKK